MSDHEGQGRRPYYFIPFGRYEGNRPAEFPGNEFLVGREKQRAELLKHLFSAGGRGAYLITGHRGSGKTSFVDHCLREYRDDVYQRYLQRNIGRAFFWDRIGQALLIAVLLLVGVLLSQALSYLLVNPEPDYLAYPAIVVLVVLLAYPWVAAYRLFKVGLELSTPTTKKKGGAWLYRWLTGPKPNLAPLLLTTLGIAFCLLVPPLADPRLGMAHAILIVALTLVVTHLFSTWFEKTNEQGGEKGSRPVARWHSWLTSFAERFRDEPADPSPRIPTDDPTIRLDDLRRHKARAWLLPWIALLTAPIIASSLSWYAGAADPVTESCLLLGVALLILSLSSMLRYLHCKAVPASTGRGSESSLWSASNWYSISALVFLVIGGTLLVSGQPTALQLLAVAVLCLGGLITLSGASLRKKKNGRILFNPRPRILLFVKAYAFLIVGIQLLFPLFPLFTQGGIEAPVIRAESLSPITALDQHTLFGGQSPEFLWLGLTIVLVLILDSTEFDWIVRPLSKMREDFSLHRSRRSELGRKDGSSDAYGTQLDRLREDYKKASRETFFWKIHSLWLPVLVVPVNLGFDTLDQRLVVEAMLAGLRAEYQKKFCRATSAFTITSKGILLLALVVGSLLLSWQFFAVEQQQQHSLERRTLCRDFVDPGYLAMEYGEVRTGIWLSCRAGGETLTQALLWRPFGSREDPSSSVSPLTAAPEQLIPAGTLLQKITKLELDNGESLFGVTLSFFFLFAVFGFVASRLANRWGLPPYRKIDARMGEVLDGLSRTLREESRPQSSPLASWLGALTAREVVQQKEGGPFDPRTVELSFLNILSDLQDPGSHFPLWSHRRISPPIPEVIFVFDELDKVGASSSADASTGPEEEANEPLDHERERTRALHRLFADLKNTICWGEARFIFIGGRNLHDEWLADGTARRPLLTHIFNLEIYVPSLLTDVDNPTAMGLQGIHALLRRQLFRANHAYRLSRMKRLRPWLTLWVEDLQDPSFVQLRYPADDQQTEPEQQTEADDQKREPDDRQCKAGGPEETGGDEFDEAWPPLRVRYSEEGDESGLTPPEGLFEHEFLQFLAYRSKGNVKRLHELIESFLDPVDSREKPKHHDEDPDYDHILAFGQRDRFRIEMIADLYRRLVPILDMRIRLRDDKIPQATLYLADFLLKFHRRAFAWSNVERVDELVHIHRAPDLRQTMQNILDSWDDRFLHRIRNGMYDFRCSSEFARELEYISRSSDEELAALNFTLDESQFLKAIYRSRIEVLGPVQGADFIAGLAELHKFDEEYELARAYLRQAISSLDARYRKEMRQWLGNPVRESFEASEEGFRTLRERLSWGVTRIRLMLQVGMTFERARNFEHAQLEYREARTLAMSLVASLSGWLYDATTVAGEAKASLETIPFEDVSKSWIGTDRLDYLITLKHLYIVFQPLLAEAWLIEKQAAGVETGPGLLDSELWALREMLPFVNSAHFGEEPKPTGPLAIRHSNFALIMAELHNKAGDLLFFKGRQLVPLEMSKKWAGEDAVGDYDKNQGSEGYLLRALHHYCIGLNDLRRLLAYRKAGSKDKYGLPCADSENRWETIVSEGWSDFIFRVAAGSLADLADTLIARCSYTRLVRCLMARTEMPMPESRWSSSDGIGGAYDLIVQWFETPGTKLDDSEFESEETGTNQPRTWPHCCATLSRYVTIDKNSLHNWLGRPQSLDENLISQKKNNYDPERLISGLLIGLVAARMLHRSGYFEAAGQQYLIVARAVASFHWLRLTLHATFAKVKKRKEWKVFTDEETGVLDSKGEAASMPFFDELLAIGVMALQEAETNFLHARPTGPGATSNGEFQIGICIPNEAFTVACSLGLAHSIGATRPETRADSEDTNRELLELCDLWFRTGEIGCIDTPEERIAYYRTALQRVTEIRRYPKLNHLNGLKVLIDSSLLAPEEPPAGNGSEKHEPRWVEYFRQMMDGDNAYDSPLHFTPLMLGSSLAAAYLLHREVLESWLEDAGGPGVEEVRRRAMETLRKSQQMYTLQKAFYECISNLYYLYDDFNDRTIHFNHALQMAGTELASFLYRNLDSINKGMACTDRPTRAGVDGGGRLGHCVR